MSDGHGDPRDPFRIGGADTSSDEPTRPPAPPPQAPPPQAPPPRRSEPNETRGLVLRVALLAAAALGLAFAVPPLGLVLGVVVAVAVVRLGVQLPTQARAIVMGSALVAAVVGLSITVVTAVFRGELAAYSDCIDGANTHLARQNCQDALYASVSDRLGL